MTVTFNEALYTLRDGESALDALIRGGANVSFSCKKGSCHTCMKRVVEGEVPAESQRGLRDELKTSGHFLPCICHPQTPITISEPDLSQLYINAMVAQKVQLSERVIRLSLELENTFDYQPGQFINLRNAQGVVRSYSTRGFTDEEYFLELDIQLVPNGEMSRWLQHELTEGESVSIQGPLGELYYRPELNGKPIILAGTGTGLAPLIGVVKAALRAGHTGGIYLYAGAQQASDLYAHAELQALAAKGVEYVPVVLAGEALEGGVVGDLTEIVFKNHSAESAGVYLAGNPDLVQKLRGEAILAGATRDRIWVDPFEIKPYDPAQDDVLLNSIQADDEMWQALEQGPRLRRILENFYARVYRDETLSPFFHNVTLDRAIDKQYSFLVDMFSGTRDFFGLKPFNTHHWMIISDEIFDYREALFEKVLREDGFPEHLIRRWLHMHERFRVTMVKTHARGLYVDGVERIQEGYSDEILEIACVCDGCFEEMPEGSHGRLHKRTGQLYCDNCAAKAPN